MSTVIPHNKVGFLAWYSQHFRKINQRNLIKLINPQRVVVDRNERIVAVMQILHDGIQAEEEIQPLLSLVQDEEDFPIFTGTRDARENNALLRGDAALALAKYASKEKSRKSTLAKLLLFTKKEPDLLQNLQNTLNPIINTMLNDPLFTPRNKTGEMYFEIFLSALYLVNKTSAERIIQAYKIPIKEIERTIS